MTKTQIVNRIARNCHIPKKQAAQMVNMFCDSVSASLKKGKAVSFAGFGSFSVKKFGGFTARNPRTGSARKVSPFQMVVFTPSASWDPARSRRRNQRKTTRKTTRRYNKH